MTEISGVVYVYLRNEQNIAAQYKRVLCTLDDPFFLDLVPLFFRMQTGIKLRVFWGNGTTEDMRESRSSVDVITLMRNVG